jgi:adenine-specific DNA-methyltransferase
VNDPKIKKWLGEVVGKEGEDLSRHDKWLCMMYPRLRLLQRLLADDGAIFISLDYHEQPYLRMICDEIFGKPNFVSEIACVNKPSGRSDDKYVATAHESIIIYRKTDALRLGLFEPGEHITSRYSKVTADGQKYREEDLRKRGTHDERIDRPNLFYPFFFSELNDELIAGNNEEETPIGYIRIEPNR